MYKRILCKVDHEKGDGNTKRGGGAGDVVVQKEEKRRENGKNI
jgi:hypothetical protein